LKNDQQRFETVIDDCEGNLCQNEGMREVVEPPLRFVGQAGKQENKRKKKL